MDPNTIHWVRRAGIGAAIGYFASQLSNWFVTGKDKPPTDLLAALCFAAAVVATRDPAHRLAACFAMIGALWLELHYSFLYSGTLASASLAALPALVVGTAFLGARRAALGMAAVTSVSAPLAATIGKWLDPTRPGIGDPTTVVVLVASLFVLAQLTSLGLESRESAIRSRFESQRRLALVVRSIPDGIVSVSRRQAVEAANPAAAMMLGFDLGTVVGRRASEVLAPLGDVSEGVVTLTTSGPPRHVEITTTRSGATGEGPKLVLLRDVTARIAAEQRERDIAERLRTSQHMETLGQFAGGIAHDMNNLVQATFGALDELDAGLAKQAVPEATRTAAGELRQIWTRGATLGRELLTFARKQPAKASSVDVIALLKGGHPLARRLVPEDIELVLTLGVQEAHVAIDPALLDRAIVNLIANARDAVSSGGRIDVSATIVGQRVLIAVIDNGSGMSDERRSRVFEPFYTTKEIGRGTGLGLSIVYGTVKQANGEIEVESTVGVGTTFMLSFPLVARPAPVAIGIGDLPRAREGEVLLLIDDEPLVRRANLRALTRLGYRVLEADNGLDGVAIAAREPVHLVVSDVVMPVMTGPEAAAKITALRPGTPVLFVSGYTREMIDDRGVSDVILKPFTLLELSTRIRSALDERSSHSAPDGA